MSVVQSRLKLTRKTDIDSESAAKLVLLGKRRKSEAQNLAMIEGGGEGVLLHKVSRQQGIYSRECF
jgi:hypothetical protein